MKKQLLMLFAMLLMVTGTFAQATAYPAPDLVQCNYEIFNLTVQSSVVLGNQDPDMYAVAYFTSQADAESNTNPIVNANAFVPNTQPQTIYAQLRHILNNDIAVTSFNVIVLSVALPSLSNVSVCSSYTLPTLTPGVEYRTAANGGGNVLLAGTVITSSQTIYIYNPMCEEESNFTVTVGSIVVTLMENMRSCGSFVLPQIASGNYYTGPNGTGTQLAAGTSVTSTQTIYVYKQVETCTAEISFTVTISNFQTIDTEYVAVCGSYTLPVLEYGGFYTEQGGDNGTGVFIPAGTQITANQTLYVYYTFGSCHTEGQFVITIVESDAIVLTPLTACGNDTGMASFDLTQAIAQIQQTIPYARVQFFTTAMDAATNTNPIVNAYAYNAVASTVYAGVTIPDNCYYTLALNLLITECTDPVLTGVVQYDADTNGCDVNDAGLAGIQVSLYMGNSTYYAFTNAAGEYAFYNIMNGTGNVQVSLNNNVYDVSPPSYDVAIDGQLSTANFCATTVDPFTDVTINVWPSTSVVPGFVAGYYIVIYNNGTTVESGQATFTFDSSKFTFLSSSSPGIVSGNTITFNYTNLIQGQQQYIFVEFTAAQPPVLNLGNEVTVSASVTPLANDMYPDNNVYSVTQTVVNSYDPNDITVDKGEFITLDQATGYLQYTIRFQNMGTANATNVRIYTILDPNLDWDTFEPIGASHDYRASRTGQDIIFNFDGIQLPYESADEPGSHGSVSYRIKPKTNIALGDVMTAQAGIYFDFNEAIITNTATTTVRAVAGLNTVSNNSFKIYPNPATGEVTLQLNTAVNNADVTITDVLGKTVLTDVITGTQAAVNITLLKSGMYFVTLKTDGRQLTEKLIVK